MREEGKKSRERNGRNRSGAITGNGEGGMEEKKKGNRHTWRGVVVSGVRQ